MIPLSIHDSGGDLVLVFTFLFVVLLAAGAGLFLGSAIGRASGDGLAPQVAVARQQVATAADRLRVVSSRLVGADRNARQAGEALVLATKLTGAANDLGGLERRAAVRTGGELE